MRDVPSITIRLIAHASPRTIFHFAGKFSRIVIRVVSIFSCRFLLAELRERARLIDLSKISLGTLLDARALSIRDFKLLYFFSA